jgi:hypothetical protein
MGRPPTDPLSQRLGVSQAPFTSNRRVRPLAFPAGPRGGGARSRLDGSADFSNYDRLKIIPVLVADTQVDHEDPFLALYRQVGFEDQS